MPLRLLFFSRQEAGLGENRSILNIFGTLKRSKVWRGLTYFPLEHLLWTTESLYQTIVVRGACDDLFHRTDKLAYQFQQLCQWLGGWWTRETRNIMVSLLEEPVELSLQLGKPNKRLQSNSKARCMEDLPLRNQVGQDLAQTSRKLIRAQAPLVEPLQVRPGWPRSEKFCFFLPGLLVRDPISDVL